MPPSSDSAHAQNDRNDPSISSLPGSVPEELPSWIQKRRYSHQNRFRKQLSSASETLLTSVEDASASATAHLSSAEPTVLNIPALSKTTPGLDPQHQGVHDDGHSPQPHLHHHHEQTDEDPRGFFSKLSRKLLSQQQKHSNFGYYVSMDLPFPWATTPLDTVGKNLVWCPRHQHFYDPLSGHVYHREHDLKTEDEELTTSQVVQDFVAGSFAGIASTAIGHPFDTVKVRLQMQAVGPEGLAFSGAWQCTLATLRAEGPLGLFRGLASPMTTVPLVNAVVFAAYGQAKSFITYLHGDTERPVTNMEAMIAGAYAGLANSIVVAPVELVKCRLQAQGNAYKSAPLRYKGPVDCVRSVLRTEGYRGLFRGGVATVYREVPSYVGQFGTYELLKRYMTPVEGEVTILNTLLCGGLAGCVCWTVSYPQDVVKSRLQTQLDDRYKPPPGQRTFDGGFMHCVRAIAREEGFRGFWRGYLPCLLRAFPANAAGFFMYEAVKKGFQLFERKSS